VKEKHNARLATEERAFEGNITDLNNRQAHYRFS
jgi:hypothetical protein